MRLILGTALLLATGCAGMGKIFVGKTSKEEVIQTGKSKKSAYDDSLVFFAKYMNDSNSAIKVKERASGQLVVKISQSCNVTLPLGYKRMMPLSYIADVKIKDKKAKLKLDVDPSYAYAGSAYSSAGRARLPASSDQQANIDVCLDSLHREITEGIKKNSKDW